MTPCTYRNVLIICILLWGYAGNASARTQAHDRPRIGLALQGGGAKGFAHIGFLQWLEEHRIPADGIAGTSMGGLIGGLYASGLSLDELRNLVTSQNWEELIGGQPPYRVLDFRRKEDAGDFPNRIEIGLRKGFRLPSGLNYGHRIGLLLDRLTLPYYDLDSFDNLPIPFRCVAVDVISGEEAVFSDGSLRDALRATMSLPAIFPPFRDKNTSYIDGGILNNLPVDVARTLDADYVIAVYLDVGDYKPDGPESLLGVVGRSIDIMMNSNVIRNMALADLVVRVDMQDFSTLDFEAGDAIIRKGYEAAEAMRSELIALSLNEEEWSRYIAGRNARKRTDIPVPEFVSVENAESAHAVGMDKELREFSGHPLDTKRLESEMDYIWGRGRYSTVGYGIVKQDNRPGLLIRPEEKTYSPPVLNLNLNIDGSDVGLVRFGMEARLTILDFGGYRSEWRTDVAFGSRNRIATEYYRALAGSEHWFAVPRGYAGNSILDIYDEGDRTSEYRASRSGFGVDVGYRFNRAAEVRIGQDITWYASRLRIGSEEFGDYSHRTGVSTLKFRYLGQDDAVVPRSGIRVKTSGAWYSSHPYGGGGFPTAEAEVSWFQPVSKPASIFLSGSGGSAFGTSDLGLISFSLGGILRLGSYGKNELLGNQYYLLTAGYIHEIASLPSLIGDKVYAAGWYQIGKMYGSDTPTGNPMDGSALLIVKSSLGPIFAGGSWGDDGHLKFYFGLGALF